MRIVAGNLKGRKFKFAIPAGVRPTQDSVRETIFNILKNYISLEEKSVADLCAGTGALGFEAYSRGANFIFFVDVSKNVTALIKKTAEDFSIPPTSFSVIEFDAVKALKKLEEIKPGLKFDVVFIDPPYRLRLGGQIIEVLCKKELLNEGAVVIYESDSFETVIAPQDMRLLSERVFSETKVTFLEYK